MVGGVPKGRAEGDVDDSGSVLPGDLAESEVCDRIAAEPPEPKARAPPRRLYGCTKPGTWLKHRIPVRTERWDVDEPGWGEIDLVSHSGPCAEGECAHSLNFTDSQSAWVETRAALGKGREGVLGALSSIQGELPFELRGLDSDNGSEFINWYGFEFCKRHQIQLSRGRPDTKDDNAHVERKNWTRVRRLVGWDRIDITAAARSSTTSTGTSGAG